MTYLRLFMVSARDAIAQYEIEQDLCELKAHSAGEAGYRNAAVITQDDGLAVGFISLWATREDAQRFHASGLSRITPRWGLLWVRHLNKPNEAVHENSSLYRHDDLDSQFKGIALKVVHPIALRGYAIGSGKHDYVRGM